MINKRAAFLVISLIGYVALPIIASAAPIPVPVHGNAITPRDIVLMVQRIMNIGIVIATLAVVAMIVYGGFKMATAGGDEKAFGAGKATLYNAMWGALVIFGVGLIVNTIANVAYDPVNVLY